MLGLPRDLVYAAIVLLLAAPAFAGDPRYCGPPKRLASGEIKRSQAVIAEFKRLHPCPSTGKTSGSCDWDLDHVLPLICGGCDSVGNLQYLPPAIKSGPGKLPKDRWERRIYCNPMQITPVPK